MKLPTVLLVVALALFGAPTSSASAPPPPRPEQPHTDQFMFSGGSYAQFNPLDSLVKTRRTAAYRLVTLPGCITGTIPQAMRQVEAEAFGKLDGLRLIRNDQTYNFTIYINCGLEQIRLCGSVNTFCLNHGFPYNLDMDISDILSTYQPVTQLSILLHEVIGHALATWEEQYCKGTEVAGICRGLPLFTSAPGWIDVMNTGANSRHGLDAIELERWSRTMYDVMPADPCVGPTDALGNAWNPCLGRWFNPAGWSYDPLTVVWFAPNGVAEWGACNLADGDCWNIRAQEWVFRGSVLYVPAGNYFSSPPLP